MKLSLKIEDGKPAIFWTDNPSATPGRVTCYTRTDQHTEASRAYMRGLRAPSTMAENIACFELLEHWARHCAYTLKL